MKIGQCILGAILFTAFLFVSLDSQAQSNLTADITGDGIVNIEDLRQMISHTGTNRGQKNYGIPFDLNTDGAIDYQDIMIFMNEWYIYPEPRTEITSETLIDKTGIKDIIGEKIEMDCASGGTLLANGLEVVSASETEYQGQNVLPLTIKSKSEDEFSCRFLLTTEGELTIPQIELVPPAIEKFGIKLMSTTYTLQFPSPMKIAGETIISGSPVINSGTTTILQKVQMGKRMVTSFKVSEASCECSTSWIDCSLEGDWSQILLLWEFSFDSSGQHNGCVYYDNRRVQSADYVYETTDEYTSLSFETVSSDMAKPGDLLYYFENPTPGSGDHFGWEMATFGNMVIVGNPFDDDDTGRENGAVYLFDSQTGELLETLSNKFPNEFSNDFRYGFGNAVGGISNYILASNYKHKVNDLPYGAIYIYNGDVNSVTFSQYIGKIDNPSPTGYPLHLGQEDLAVNGNVLATHAGNTVYFYRFSPEKQVFNTTPLIITDPNPYSTSTFGEIMKPAGPNMLISSAYQKFYEVPGVGVVYIYDCDPSSQTYGTLLKTINNPEPAPTDYETFGKDLAYIDNYIAISAPGHDPDEGHYKGTVYIFDGDPDSSTYGDLINTIRNPMDTTTFHGLGYALTGIGDYFAASDTTQGNVYFFEPLTGRSVLIIDNLGGEYRLNGTKLDTVNGNLVVADYEYNTGVVYLFKGM